MRSMDWERTMEFCSSDPHSKLTSQGLRQTPPAVYHFVVNIHFLRFLLYAHTPNRSSGSVEKNVFKVVNKSFSLPLLNLTHQQFPPFLFILL